MKYFAALLLITSFALAEEPSSVQIATRATEALKANLSDPYSLRLSRVTLYKRPTKGEIVSLVCMEFNAKNLMGGYAGADIASFLILPNKVRLSVGDFMAVDYCKSFAKEASKGKATFEDLTPQFALSATPSDPK